MIEKDLSVLLVEKANRYGSVNTKSTKAGTIHGSTEFLLNVFQFLHQGSNAMTAIYAMIFTGMKHFV